MEQLLRCYVLRVIERALVNDVEIGWNAGI